LRDLEDVGRVVDVEGGAKKSRSLPSREKASAGQAPSSQRIAWIKSSISVSD